MNDLLKKITNVCKLIFGYGIMITLFVGGLTFFGYLIALIVGGEMANNICVFIYEKVVPKMIYCTACLVLFGLVTMYLAGEKALVSSKNSKKTDYNNSDEVELGEKV